MNYAKSYFTCPVCDDAYDTRGEALECADLHYAFDNEEDWG